MFVVTVSACPERSNMASNEKYTILYGRLSQEDTQKANKADDSNSIQNHDVMYRGWITPKNITS